MHTTTRSPAVQPACVELENGSAREVFANTGGRVLGFDFDAAGKLGYDISMVYYDVCRKPAIRPYKSVNELDEQGRKIIVDSSGKRVFKTKKVKVKVGKGKKAKEETKEVEDF